MLHAATAVRCRIVLILYQKKSKGGLRCRPLQSLGRPGSSCRSMSKPVVRGMPVTLIAPVQALEAVHLASMAPRSLSVGDPRRLSILWLRSLLLPFLLCVRHRGRSADSLPCACDVPAFQNSHGLSFDLCPTSNALCSRRSYKRELFPCCSKSNFLPRHTNP